MKNRRKEKKTRDSANVPAYRSVVEEEPAAQAPPRKQRRKGRSTGLFLLRLLAVAAVVVLLVVGWQYRESFMPDSVLLWADELLAGTGRGDGYPVTISGSTIKAMEPVRNTLAYLTDTSLVMLSDSGGEVVNRAHSFVDPAMKVAGDYALVAEIGGKRLRLERRSGTVREHTHFDEIQTAAVSENGRFAVVTGESKSYLSRVSVYDAQDRNIYNWYSSEQLVADVALSRNGHYMAVIGLSAEGGSLCSTLYLFDLEQDETQPVSFSGTDLMLCSVRYLRGGQVVAVGDTALWTVDKERETKTEYLFGNSELQGAAFSETTAAVSLRQYGTTTGGTVVIVDEQGAVCGTRDFADSYRDIAASDDEYLLLTNREVLSVRRDGTTRTAKISADGQQIASVGRTVYVMGLTEIRQVTFD